MEVKHHWAVFLSNEADSNDLTEEILESRAKHPFTHLNAMKGVLFSTVTLHRLIDEESRRDQLDVTKHLNRQLRTLSSGEQKKALLEYLLAKEPDFIILDNPFDNLDKASQQSLKEKLTEISLTTTLIQLIYRKSDLLPFIKNAVTLFEGNQISQSADPQTFCNNNKTNPSELLSGPVPQPILQYQLEHDELVKFKQVTVSYGERTIVRDINWTIKKGEFWQLSGPNGSGKTTLLTMITGDNPKGYGKDFELFGKKKGSGETVWDIKKKVGYVTPAMTELFTARHTLEEMVISGFFDSIGLYVYPSEMEIRLANEWLELTQLKELKNKPFCELSPGLQRKALIIRAMVKHPPLLILDEPAFGLDDHNTRMVTALINKIASESTTAILYVSHRSEDGIFPDAVFELIPTDNGSIGIIS